MKYRTTPRSTLIKIHDMLVGYMARSGLLLTAIPMSADTLDAIPESQRGLYKEVNGKFTLDVEGYEDPTGLKSALQKERDTAKAATKESSAWKSFGKTPDEIKELIDKQRDLEDQKLIAEKNFEELAKKRTERMQADHDKQLKSSADTIAQLNAKAARLAAGKVASAITEAALKAGALPDAMRSIALQGADDGWTINDAGDVVAMRDGEVVLSKDGKSPLSLAEWAEGVRDASPYLWPKAQGTGAPGASGQGGKNLPSGDFGGSRTERQNAIAKKFNLPKA